MGSSGKRREVRKGGSIAPGNRLKFTQEAFESLEPRGEGLLRLQHGRAGTLPCGQPGLTQDAIPPLQGGEEELLAQDLKEESCKESWPV